MHQEKENDWACENWWKIFTKLGNKYLFKCQNFPILGW